jgi:hypothetical protein
MIAQSSRRGGEAEMAAFFPAQLFGDLINAGKEGMNEIVEFLARRSQSKGASLEEPHPEVIFELKDLAAHCRLLNPIRHLSHGFGNALVFGYEIEQLEVVDIHAEEATRERGEERPGWKSLIGDDYPGKTKSAICRHQFVVVPASGG